MANNFVVMYRGAAPTVSTTLYTAPANALGIVTSILVTNSTASAQTYTLSINGVPFASSTYLPPNDTAMLEIKQVIPSNQIMTGLASSNLVYFHISGLQVT